MRLQDAKQALQNAGFPDEGARHRQPQTHAPQGKQEDPNRHEAGEDPQACRKLPQ